MQPSTFFIYSFLFLTFILVLQTGVLCIHVLTQAGSAFFFGRLCQRSIDLDLDASVTLNKAFMSPYVM